MKQTNGCLVDGWEEQSTGCLVNGRENNQLVA